MLSRVLIIANKSWEADPLVSVCFNPKLRSPALTGAWDVGGDGLFSSVGNGARPDQTHPTPRCTYKTDAAKVEVWCIEDWMGDANHSSSKVKKEIALPAIFKAGPPPEFVVAFGTAGFPDASTANGCVSVGSSSFLFNPYSNPPTGVSHDNTNDWDDPKVVGKLMTSPVGSKVIGQFGQDPDWRFHVDARLSPAPTNPLMPPVLLAASNYVALSDINITNYDDYAWADRFAYNACQAAAPAAPVGSIETIHGLIRSMSKAPFIFVSGITDRLGYFNQDLNPRTVAQNFLAAHNAGVALTWILPIILANI